MAVFTTVTLEGTSSTGTTNYTIPSGKRGLLTGGVGTIKCGGKSIGETNETNGFATGCFVHPVIVVAGDTISVPNNCTCHIVLEDNV